MRLKTERATPEEMRGTFTVILYGGRHPGDVETIALMDKEGDSYTIEPYAPEFDYRILKGLSAREALERARSFVSQQASFSHAELSSIVDDAGNVLGYEVRPLYLPVTYGISDVLDVTYSVKDDSVVARIRLMPSVERMLFS